MKTRKPRKLKEPQKYYLVMNINFWATSPLNIPLTIGDQHNSVGFIRVFDDLKKAQTEFPYAQITIVEQQVTEIRRRK